MSWLDYVPGLGIPGVGNVTDIPGALGGLTNRPGDANRGLLNQQAAQAGNFAGVGEANYANMTAQGQSALDYLRQLSQGQNSVSAEQLRQGLQQNLASQQSMAASASPQNAAMAARTAAMQMGRLGYGMSGQQAIAGLQERNQAMQNYASLLQGMRGQDVNAALGSRQNAISGYGTGVQNPGQSTLEQWAPILNAGASAAGMAAKSDKRAKTDIKDADDDAARMLNALKTYKYRYKDERDGKGEQFGILAQEMERAGLKHAVIDTPAGKMVDGAKTATSALALTAALARRVSKLEGK